MDSIPPLTALLNLHSTFQHLQEYQFRVLKIMPKLKGIAVKVLEKRDHLLSMQSAG